MPGGVGGAASRDAPLSRLIGDATRLHSTTKGDGPPQRSRSFSAEYARILTAGNSGWASARRGGPRHRQTTCHAVPSRAAYTGTTAAGSGSVSRVTPRIWRLLFPPQSPDEPIDRKLWLGVRVVAAGAARAIALFSGAHVIVGQMMAPEARSEHGSNRLNARTRSASAHSSVLCW